MNKTLKWILIGLGIALAAFLVTLAVFGALWMHRNGGGYFGMMHGYPRGMMFPMMGFFGFFRALIPLGILVLAVFGVIYLVRGGAKKHTQSPLPPVPVVPAPRVCVSCGKVLPVEGDFCPFCGTKQ